MENETPTQELEDEVHEAIVEAIDGKESMDDLKKNVGQRTLLWFEKKRHNAVVQRRKFFQLRKVKREEKPDSK